MSKSMIIRIHIYSYLLLKIVFAAIRFLERREQTIEVLKLEFRIDTGICDVTKMQLYVSYFTWEMSVEMYITQSLGRRTRGSVPTRSPLSFKKIGG